MDYVLAQVHIARPLAPLDSPLLADFVAGPARTGRCSGAAAGGSPPGVASSGPLRGPEEWTCRPDASGPRTPGSGRDGRDGRVGRAGLSFRLRAMLPDEFEAAVRQNAPRHR